MIHAFTLNGEYIVLDVASGSVHHVDKSTYEIISSFDEMFDYTDLALKFSDRYPKGDLSEIYSEIREIYDMSALYSVDDCEALYFGRNNDKAGLKAICLNAAHDCNLTCEYCFASKGSYKSRKEMMDAKTARAALLFLVGNSGSRTNLEVDFFGGEPLLNFGVIKDTVLYGDILEKEYGKKINYTVTTNGTIMNDEIKTFINERMSNLVISIDGRRSVHDSARRFDLSRGSYDTVVRNARYVLDQRGEEKTHYIRGTFTRKNLDFTQDVKHLYEEGFREISIEPVVGRGEYFHLTDDDIEKIKDEYEILAGYIQELREKGRYINFYHFNANIYDGPCVYKRISACGAGYEYLAVAPGGKIYPCHQFVGIERFEMGSVYDGIIKEKTACLFRENNVFSKSRCGGCWAKYTCSGGCHADAFFRNGDIGEPEPLTCELQKKRIECALYLEVKKKMQEQ